MTEYAASSSMFNPIANDTLYAPLTQEGAVCGVGINLSLIHDPPLYDNEVRAGVTYRYIVIVDSVESNTSASKAGIQSGDVIVQVDGTNILDKQQMYLPDDVADLIRGPEGSSVTIVIGRDYGEKRIKLVLRRGYIEKSPPKSPLTNQIGKAIAAVTPEIQRNLEDFTTNLTESFPQMK